MTIYVGIDNGLDGGITAITDSGEIISRRVMPTVKLGKGRRVDPREVEEELTRFRRWNSEVYRVFIIVEEAAKHSPGKLALCSTWHSFGVIQTTIELGMFQHEIITPQKWQKTFWATPRTPKGQKFDTKAAALNAANRIWPDADWRKSERSRKAHDGIVDAALIAEYGRRNNL